MNKVWRAASGVLLAAAAAACSSSAPKSPSPAIPTGGETRTLAGLAGRWEGSYTNPVNKRTGTIVLEFSSSGKAQGDILMLPPEAKKPSPEETLRTMPRVLEINFIEAAGNTISGTVGPYEDPDSRCNARTAFSGTVAGDTIEGTFRTDCLGSGGKPDPKIPSTSGAWKVTRIKKG